MKRVSGARASDGEASAALAATRSQDGLPGDCRHAGTEPVGTLAAHDGRLECAFHGKGLGEKAFD
jgi:hypothetical protein